MLSVNILSTSSVPMGQSNLIDTDQVPISSQVERAQDTQSVQLLPTTDNLDMEPVPTLISIVPVDEQKLPNMDQVPISSQVGGTQDTQIVQSLPTPDSLNKISVPIVKYNLAEMDQVLIGSQAGGAQGTQIAHPLPASDNLNRGGKSIFMIMIFGFIFMTQINTLIPCFFTSKTKCIQNFEIVWSHSINTTGRK